MEIEADKAAPVKGPLPPTLHLHDFLDRDEHAALLDWVDSNRERFEAAHVDYGDDQRIDDRIRVALNLRDLGPLKSVLTERLLAVLPRIVESIGGRISSSPSLELELTAYGDGAFFRIHEDIPVGRARDKIAKGKKDRLLSAVYYFHRQPKAFTGGELRTYRWGADMNDLREGDYRDLPPDDNSLVAFPSWATHEVRPVACESQRFEDYRYALNCWYREHLPGN